jgi:glycosyltransferase involved in cell wall biosynthesis
VHARTGTALVADVLRSPKPGLVTIGITCFEAADTIGAALESAGLQDWPDTELLVVDDCSTDDSTAIVERSISGRPNARLIRHRVNSGPGAARNTILGEAQGEFVVFFDDDDESTSDRVRRQVETLRGYESRTGAQLVACFASGRRRYSNGYELSMPAIGSQPQPPTGPVVADYLLYNLRVPGNFYGSGTPTCALMARLATFRTVGGFDSSFRRAEDIDFAVRLALAGGHFVGCPEELFVQSATFAPDKTPTRNLEAELRLVEKHAAYLKARGRYEYARRWFCIRHFHFTGQRYRFFVALTALMLRHPVEVVRHLARSGPARRAHERKMAAPAPGARLP